MLTHRDAERALNVGTHAGLRRAELDGTCIDGSKVLRPIVTRRRERQLARAAMLPHEQMRVCAMRIASPAVASLVVLAGCSMPCAASPIHETGQCNLQTNSHDLIPTRHCRAAIRANVALNPLRH
jgi:hypothetical protein